MQHAVHRRAEAFMRRYQPHVNLPKIGSSWCDAGSGLVSFVRSDSYASCGELLSSITMPKGLVLTLFTRDELKGMSLNLTSSESCLSQQACPLDLQTTKWAEPAPRCKGDVWDNQAVSLTLTYANGLLPNYTPRPSAETGARAFALSGLPACFHGSTIWAATLRMKSRQDRPAGALTQYYRAPRNGDREECAVRVGSYSADPICLQPYKMEVPEAQTNWVRKNPFKLYETLAEKERLHEFSDEFARLKRREWRQTLKEYAEPFYLSRIMSGEIGPEVELIHGLSGGWRALSTWCTC